MQYNTIQHFIFCNVWMSLVEYDKTLKTLTTRFSQDVFTLHYTQYFTEYYAAAQLVEWRCHKPEGRGFDSRWCQLHFSSTWSFRPHYGPGVDSASNRNEYQEYFLGVKAAGAYGWQPYQLHALSVLKSGSLNLLEPSGPVQACNGIVLPLQHLTIYDQVT